MVKRGIRTMAWVGLMLPALGFGQEPCANGIRIDGLITDPTGAEVVGAQVQAANGERTTTDPTGHYVLPCVSSSTTIITVQADGFSQGSAQARARLVGDQAVNTNPVRAGLLSKSKDRQHQPNPCHRPYPALDHEIVRLLV